MIENALFMDEDLSATVPLLRHPSSPATNHSKMTDTYAKTTSPGNDSLRSQPLMGELDVEVLTLYEKKCILINREIDSHGMGRYQWYIWGLCGFGYMLDLLWAQAFGLVLSPIQQEFGFSSTRPS